MSFVKELIDTEEKRAFYNSFNLKNYRGKPLDSDDWYVDHENNYYIVGMGGGSFEIPMMYGIIVPHGIIVLQSDIDFKSRLDRICYQKTIELSIEEIKTLVSNALIDLKDQYIYSAYENTNLKQLPEPVLVNDFEEKYYVIKC